MGNGDATHVELLLADLRPLVYTRRERVADVDVLRLLCEAPQELVVDASLDVDARAGAAGLAVVPAGKER
jgi:hypothetical protein